MRRSGAAYFDILASLCRAEPWTNTIRVGRETDGRSNQGTIIMSIDRNTARRVASLARIAVENDELDGLADELNDILAFMDELGEADIEGVEAMTSVSPMELKSRTDKVVDNGNPEKILSNAPEVSEGFFVVPRVVE